MILGLVLWCGLAGQTLPAETERQPKLTVSFGGEGHKKGDDGVTVVEPGPVEVRIQAAGARRVWMHYYPNAGEARRYYFPAPIPEFVHVWKAETDTGGNLSVSAEDGGGLISFSEPAPIASASYRALRQVAEPDPHVRIEVNLPAFELGVYRANHLLRRFRVGIGIKSWPAPPGMRLAREIVWNPQWAPPDSPWATPDLVRRLRARGEVLGRMKIPLGGEILIHGTSKPSDLGRAVSHGCLRMLNRDVWQLARLLIQHTGAEASEARIRRAEKQKRHAYHVPLPKPVIVTIRYDPVVLREGRVIEYRDVYGWSPVTAERLAAMRALAEPLPAPVKPVAARKRRAAMPARATSPR